MAFRIVGAVGIRVRPDTTQFGRELQEKLAKEDDKHIQIPVDAKDTALKEQVRKIANQASRDAIAEKIAVKVPAILNADGLEDSTRRAVKKVQNAVISKRMQIEIPVVIDESKLANSVRDAMDKTEAELKRRGDLKVTAELALDKTVAEADFKHFVDKHNNTTLDINANIDKRGRVSAELDILAHRRDVKIKPTLDKAAYATVMASLAGLSGANVLKDVKDLVKHVAENIDSIALTVGKFGIVAGNVINLAGSLAGALASIGTGVFQLGGFALGVPAALASTVAAVAVGVAVFKNFGSAVGGNNAALAKLPANAAAAARALQGTWTSIAVPTQASFWNAVGPHIADQVNSIINVIRSGMAKVGASAGSFTAGAMRAFTDLANRGELASMFSNMAKGIQQASRGARPLIDAINRIGLVGTQYMPKIGNYFSDLATKFDQWATNAQQTGKIDLWFKHAVQSASELKTIFGDAIGIFRSISGAAHNAGIGGLKQLSDGFDKIRKIVESNRFQTTLSTIFDGARDGMHNLEQGLGPLGRSLASLAPTLAGTLRTVGSTAGTLLKQVSDILANGKFQSGMQSLFTGLNTGIAGLSKFIPNIAAGVGSLASISGTVFKNVLPVAGQALSIVATAIQSLEGPLKTVSPVLTGAFSAGLGALATLLPIIAPLAQAFATALAAIPAPVLAALTAVVLLRKAMGGPGGMFGRLVNPFSNLTGWAQGAVSGVTRAFRPMVTELSDIGNRAGVGINEGLNRVFQSRSVGRAAAASVTAQFASAFNSLPTVVQKLQQQDLFGSFFRSWGQGLRAGAASAFATIPEIAKGSFQVLSSVAGGATRAIGASLKGAISGVMSLLGGPWGLALTGAMLLLSGFSTSAQRTADTLSQVKSLVTELSNTKFKNPLTPTTQNADAQKAAADQADKLIQQAQQYADMVNGSNVLSGKRQSLIDVILGGASQSEIKQITDLINQFQGAGGNSLTRAIDNAMPGSDSIDAAHQLQLALQGIVGASGDASAALQTQLGDAAGVVDFNLNLAGDAVAKFGQITLQNVPQITKVVSPLGPGGVMDTAANNVRSMAEIMADSLGGPSDQIASNAQEIAKGLQSVGSNAQGIARFMSADGFSNPQITTVLEALGLSADDAANAISFKFGPATTDFGKAIQVLGHEVPKLYSASDGINEISDALSSATGIDATTLETTFHSFGTSVDGIVKGLSAQGVSKPKILEVLKDLGVDGVSAQQAIDRLAKTVRTELGPNAFSAQQVATYATALQQIAKNAGDAATNAGLLRDALDTLNGGKLSTTRLRAKLSDDMDAIRQLISGNGTKGIKGKPLAIDWSKVFDANGQLNVQNNAVRQVFEQLDSTATDALATVTDAYGKAIASGKGYAGAQKAAQIAADGVKVSLEKLLDPLGKNKAAVDAVLKAMGLWPDQLVTNAVVSTRGATQPLVTVLGLMDAAARKGAKKINIGVQSASAISTLQSLGIKVSKLADGTYVVTMGANSTAARGEVARLEQYVNSRNFNVDITGNIRVTKITYMGQPVYRTSSGALFFKDGGIMQGGVQVFANGGINRKAMANMQAFANGGFPVRPKPTAAHIAPGGQYILYAERETGGEAFIPLAPSKRARSQQVLAETAREIGMVALPAGALQKFADGGINNDTNVGGVNFHIGAVYNPVAEPLTRTAAEQRRLAGQIGVL